MKKVDGNNGAVNLPLGWEKMKSYKIKKDPNVLAHPEGEISFKVFKTKCVGEVRKIQ